jgi:hypothetical protein
MRLATPALLTLAAVLTLAAPARAQNDRCALLPDTVFSHYDFTVEHPRALQRVVFEDLTGGANTTVPAGTVIRFYSDPVGGPYVFGLPGGPTPAYAFVEVQRPGGAPACGGGNQQGCAETGGVWVYTQETTYAYEVATAVNRGANSTNEFHLTSAGGAGPEGSLAPYTNAYEIRFDQTSWATNPFADPAIGSGWGFEVPFSLWDIGPVEPLGTNDPGDDVRMLPGIFSDVATAPEDMCANNATSLPYRFLGEPGAGMQTDRVYAYYATTSYDEFAAAAAEAIVASEPEPLPAGFALRGARPNPARGAAHVAYAVGEAGPVRLEVLDALGRRVALLVDGVRPAGEHRAAVDAAGLRGGVYLLRMTAGGGVATSRLSVVR